MNRAEILDTARQAVTVERAATHGDAEDTFGSIAAVWSARLGVTITPAQVAIMLVDLKTCRAWKNPGHADSWVDMAGYAACGGEIATQDSGPDFRKAEREALKRAIDSLQDFQKRYVFLTNKISPDFNGDTP